MESETAWEKPCAVCFLQNQEKRTVNKVDGTSAKKCSCETNLYYSVDEAND